MITMKNQKKSYYKEGIRKMLLLYSIIPVAFLTLMCLFIFVGIWFYSTKSTIIKENRTVTKEIESTIDAYTNLIKMFEQKESIFKDKLTVKQKVDIYENVYDVANQLHIKAQVYIFDQSISPILTSNDNTSNNKIPYYLDGYSRNWGIFRIMKLNPDKIAIKILNELDEEHMQILIGKAMIIDHEIKGYTLFAIDSHQYQVNIANYYSQMVITDENGWVFVSNNYKYLDTLERFNINIEEGKCRVYKVNGDYVIGTSSYIDGKINVYSILSLNNQILLFKYVIYLLLFVFTMMFLFVYISSEGMAARKTKDLYLIIDAFEKTKQGDLEKNIEISSQDEFKTIADAYNQMLGSLKEQKERNIEMGKLVALSQVKQLESQFNPHFLFNTLENIRFMCRMEPEIASKMVLNLSTLLRYSISNTQEEVTVGEDITYTENYMSILKFRFNQRFQYTIDILSEIEECIIPKLLIQPMIENSIKYGFIGRESLVVEISGYIEDDKLIMICEDDGAGMTAKTLEEMKQVLNCEVNKSSHTGLYNINRRLQLKYGDGYGIQLDSELNKGTILKVILPVRYEKDSGGWYAENTYSGR